MRGVNLSIHREREEGHDHLDDPRSGRALALGHGVRRLQWSQTIAERIKSSGDGGGIFGNAQLIT